MGRIFHYLYVEGALPSVKFLSQQRMAPCKVPHLRLLVLRNFKCKVCRLLSTQMNHSQSVSMEPLPSKSMETVLDILNCDTLPSRNNSNLAQGALLTICLGGVLSAS